MWTRLGVRTFAENLPRGELTYGRYFEPYCLHYSTYDPKMLPFFGHVMPKEVDSSHIGSRTHSVVADNERTGTLATRVAFPRSESALGRLDF